MGRTGKLKRQLRRIAAHEYRKAARGTVADIVRDATLREARAGLRSDRWAVRWLRLRMRIARLRFRFGRCLRAIKAFFGAKR